MNKDYTIKIVRFHKEDDKDLIEVLQHFSERRKLSSEVKNILREYFNLDKRKDQEILELVKEIKNTVKNNNFFVKETKIENFPSLNKTEGQNINDLMSLKDSDEGEELF